MLNKEGHYYPDNHYSLETVAEKIVGISSPAILTIQYLKYIYSFDYKNFHVYSVLYIFFLVIIFKPRKIIIFTYRLLFKVQSIKHLLGLLDLKVHVLRYLSTVALTSFVSYMSFFIFLGIFFIKEDFY